MANLDALTKFASEHQHNLTGPLKHKQVEQLAAAWLPRIRFHENERFHPIPLTSLFTVPPEAFRGMTDAEKDSFRVGAFAFGERFDPPIVVDGSGFPTVLGSGARAAEALDDVEISTSSFYSYGGRLEAGYKFFGSEGTLKGGDVGPGNPRKPRHLPVTVHAELRMLLEMLKHEIQLDSLPSFVRKPIDAIWTGFDVEELFFIQAAFAADFARREQRATLARLIDAHEHGDTAKFDEELESLPKGWTLAQRAWDAVTRFAFLEFYFVYAFNDYKEYGEWPFQNEHEGDVEGCCVVFTRASLERFAAGGLLEDAVPHTVISSVHNESDGLDKIKKLPSERVSARLALIVYPAVGSHATYLANEEHDILGFGDVVVDKPGDVLGTLVVLGALTGTLSLLPVLAFLFGLLELLLDAEDYTSDEGGSIGPDPPGSDPLVFERRIVVTPLSHFETGVNIYQAALRPSLALRGFPGPWGATSGFVDKSPGWQTKTGRYFRKFVKNGEIAPEIF